MAGLIPVPSSNRTKEFTNSGDNEDFFFYLNKLPFRTLFLYAMDVVSAFYIPVLVFGLTANILNITVFAKTGVRDNVTVSLLALSISDLTYLVVIFPYFTVIATIHYVEIRLGININWPFDIRVIVYLSYWYSFIFYETSILITVYIAVVRCACVAMPFTVKNTFTSRKAIVTFIAFFIIVVLLRIPIFMTKRVILHFDPISNTTRVVYKEFNDGGLAQRFHDIMNRNILNWASIVIVIASLVVMVAKLRASVRFRASIGAAHSAAAQADTNDGGLNNARATSSRHHPTQPLGHNDSSSITSGVSQRPQSAQTTNDFVNRLQTVEKRGLEKSPIKTNKVTRHKGKSESSSEKGNQEMLSSREAQVVRCVILVAAVFVICQAPLMAYTLARRFEPQFDSFDVPNEKFKTLPKYAFLFALVTNISSFFTIINASVNIIIHYNFNSRYRESLKTLWNSK
ncbi:hypothetical protein RRG08_019690 [Elysia crispata]|uniref:G-protein coupled receptors family 1 profile domain-containing protein n=1 Tax=Elysia crispata TaxID=231223 RepID=A0AAE0XST7_9GAST|nr:hypothetical protein RRG08_019690 [Elysia crispata]